ncbi:hypothetical protein Tco_1021043, partial [Tanacetum coccineum]
MNARGDQRLKSSDYELVRKIKERVQNLPDLEIPPENAYIILETYGCMEGWRGIVKWKKKCTGEIKQSAAATLYSVKKVLQFPNTFQKNMKITCEESPKTLNYQQQRKKSKPCKFYKQSYNAKPKYASARQLKTTTGLTKEKTSEFKTKRPEESSLNWRPLHNDWATTTSKSKEVQDYTQEDNTYRYNRKRFLEDDDSSDDSIFIMDPRLDDYCLQELKLNRPVPCCPYAQRAR